MPNVAHGERHHPQLMPIRRSRFGAQAPHAAVVPTGLFWKCTWVPSAEALGWPPTTLRVLKINSSSPSARWHYNTSRSRNAFSPWDRGPAAGPQLVVMLVGDQRSSAFGVRRSPFVVRRSSFVVRCSSFVVRHQGAGTTTYGICAFNTGEIVPLLTVTFSAVPRPSGVNGMTCTVFFCAHAAGSVHVRLVPFQLNR